MPFITSGFLSLLLLLSLLKPYHWFVFKGMASSCANGFSNLSRRAGLGGGPPVSKVTFCINCSLLRFLYEDLATGRIVFKIWECYIRNCGLSVYVRTEIGREYRDGLASCSVTRLSNIVWFSVSSQVIVLFLQLALWPLCQHFNNEYWIEL